MEEPKITEHGDIISLRSSTYNWNLNMEDGYFERWGINEKSNAEYSPYGPEILDLEISTKCNGGCPYCYKSNNSSGDNLSFVDFVKIIENVNPRGNLRQVAFGLSADGISNPEIWEMCSYLREKKIVPNGTVANISKETAENIAEWFGAVAVSFHKNFNDPFNHLANQVEMLSNAGMKQVNIHFVLHKGSLEDLYDLVTMIKNDSRFKGLNAIVLLGLKLCGRAYDNKFQPLEYPQFETVVKKLIGTGLGFGFDSCSATSAERVFRGMDKCNPKAIEEICSMIEPCESGLFSQYIDCKGTAYPCSFSPGLEPGFDMINTNKEYFLDYWNFNPWRVKLLKNNRACPMYIIHPEIKEEKKNGA